jgi:hypothetical protein
MRNTITIHPIASIAWRGLAAHKSYFSFNLVYKTLLNRVVPYPSICGTDPPGMWRILVMFFRTLNHNELAH